MHHGGGGKAMQQLIEQLFYRHFDNEMLAQCQDQASFSIESGRMVMTTDSHVVTPLFFPGGDIGSLSVNGTVNDLCMAGAKPLYLSVGFILEEGFPLNQLQKIVKSMATACQIAGVNIVTGDTKVVEKGACDGVFINTAGVGIVPSQVTVTNRMKEGDKIIVTGCIGNHGIAILSTRENLSFETAIESDCRSLADLVANLTAYFPTLNAMRDPTRGGLAAVLNEWANTYQVGFSLDEAVIPVEPQVMAACELLGIEPIHVANEGCCVICCDAAIAKDIVKLLRQHPAGKQAVIIGEVTTHSSYVELATSFGGKRLVDWLSGEQLPRIC